MAVSTNNSLQTQSEAQKPRVLLIAPDCNPQWHSLPALIAEYYKALEALADITLVTHIRNKLHLTPFLSANAKVDYIDSDKIAAPIYKLTQKLVGNPDKAMTLQVALSYPSHLYFEYLVWKKYKQQLLGGEFDIVHRASPMSPTIPSPIAKRCPVPFVIGPVLGALAWPDVFKHEMRREGEWMNYFRALHKRLPYYQSTYKHAAAVLAGYKHTVNDIPAKNHARVIEFSEGGIHPSDFPEREFLEKKQATILFVGRIVPFKQPEVLIRTFAQSALLQNHKLIIVGNGPDLTRLKKLTSELNLEKCVTLTGSLPVEDVRQHMREADIFAFPSIREQGGGVLTMASMSCTPCVVVDYGGPARRVPEKCGIKVPLSNAEGLIESFKHALEHLVEHPDERQAMGMAARAFTSKYYSWEWKAKVTSEVYRWVLGQRDTKPSYWAESL